MRPQDIIVALKAFNWERNAWTQAQLAKSLHISVSEVNHALKRLEDAKLYNPETKSAVRSSLLEFLVHGLKYAFPAKPGPITLGMPTAYSVPPLSKQLSLRVDDKCVWPYAKGKVRGQSVEPLIQSAPRAAEEDPELHKLLAMIDAIRIGKAREVTIATKYLEEKLLKHA